MKYTITQDGNKAMVTSGEFLNLQESIAGFGNTEQEAIVDLLEKLYAEVYDFATTCTDNNGYLADIQADFIKLWPKP